MRAASSSPLVERSVPGAAGRGEALVLLTGLPERSLERLVAPFEPLGPAPPSLRPCALSRHGIAGAFELALEGVELRMRVLDLRSGGTQLARLDVRAGVGRVVAAREQQPYQHTERDQAGQPQAEQERIAGPLSDRPRHSAQISRSTTSAPSRLTGSRTERSSSASE
jgi:hypothetical protein